MKEFFFRKEKHRNRRVITILNLFSFSYIRNKRSKAVKQSSCIYNKKFMPDDGIEYMGNPEYGVFDLSLRWESPDMIASNIAIGENFLNDFTKLVNIGSGTGTLEYYNAPKFPQSLFVASEYDLESLKWSKSNRNLPNVVYCSLSMDELLHKYGKFDIAVSIDVIEHIANYKAFLDSFVRLADRAVISTPNRDRYFKIEDIVRPPYDKHVQEFNAGELYFILKMYYKKVTIFSHLNPETTDLIKVGIYSCHERLVALCEN